MVRGVESAKKVSNLIKQVKKRNGKLVDFDVKKIFNAVFKAMLATGEGTEFDASRVAEQVVLQLSKAHIKNAGYTPTVEEVQDAVERELMWEDFVETAKAYILYRSK
ncbi:MAG TPA: ATP cone domain-containing protein, partial [Candidatus Paceibacterota bacterium]